MGAEVPRARGVAPADSPPASPSKPISSFERALDGNGLLLRHEHVHARAEMVLGVSAAFLSVDGSVFPTGCSASTCSVTLTPAEAFVAAPRGDAQRIGRTARQSYVPNCGHFAREECPEAISSQLLPFLRAGR